MVTWQALNLQPSVLMASLLMAGYELKVAYTAWYASHHLTVTTTVILHFRQCLYRQRLMTILKLILIRRMSVPIPTVRRVRVVSTLTKPIRQFVSLMHQRVSWWHVRTNVHSMRTVIMRGSNYVPNSMS